MTDTANDKKDSGDVSKKRKAPAKSKKGSSLLDEAKAAFKDLDTSNGRTLRKRTEKQTPKAAAPKKAPASKGKPKGGAKKAKKEEEKTESAE